MEEAHASGGPHAFQHAEHTATIELLVLIGDVGEVIKCRQIVDGRRSFFRHAKERHASRNRLVEGKFLELKGTVGSVVRESFQFIGVGTNDSKHVKGQCAYEGFSGGYVLKVGLRPCTVLQFAEGVFVRISLVEAGIIADGAQAVVALTNVEGLFASSLKAHTRFWLFTISSETEFGRT